MLAGGAEDDLTKIVEYTVTCWGAEQARRYGSKLAGHFNSLANESARTKSVFKSWPELQVSRCQHHYVFSIRRTALPLAILAVFHEHMDLPARLHERLDAEDHLVRE